MGYTVRRPRTSIGGGPFRGPMPIRDISPAPAQSPSPLKNPKHSVFAFVLIGIVVVVLLVLIFIQLGPKSKISYGEVEMLRNELSADANPSLISGNIVKSYTIPSGFNEICFSDVRNIDVGDIVDDSDIQDSVARGSLRNVFLSGDGKKVSFYVEHLGVPGFPYYNCVNVENGKVDVSLNEVDGNVEVKLPANENYCINAQNTFSSDGKNLCGYLDSVYYQGYKGECCQDYGYCC